MSSQTIKKLLLMLSYRKAKISRVTVNPQMKLVRNLSWQEATILQMMARARLLLKAIVKLLERKNFQMLMVMKQTLTLYSDSCLWWVTFLCWITKWTVPRIRKIMQGIIFLVTCNLVVVYCSSCGTGIHRQ